MTLLLLPCMIRASTSICRSVKPRSKAELRLRPILESAPATARRRQCAYRLSLEIHPRASCTRRLTLLKPRLGRTSAQTTGSRLSAREAKRSLLQNRFDDHWRAAARLMWVRLGHSAMSAPVSALPESGHGWTTRGSYCCLTALRRDEGHQSAVDLRPLLAPGLSLFDLRSKLEAASAPRRSGRQIVRRSASRPWTRRAAS